MFDPHRPKINDQQSLKLAKGDGFKDPFMSGTIFPVNSIPDLYLIKVALRDHRQRFPSFPTADGLIPYGATVS